MSNIEGLSIVIAIGFGVFSIVGVMISLFLWNRSESNSDRRFHGESIDSIKKDLNKMYWRINKFDGRKW